MNFLRSFSKVSIFNLLSTLLVLIFIFGFVRDLIFEIYDLDLDGELYFGSRLFYGELIFVEELHDKLPFVQFLFSLLSFTKNKLLFTILNGTTTVFAALLYRKYLTANVCNEFQNISKEYLQKIANLFSSIFLTLSVINPGSLNTISSISSGLNLLAIGFLISIKKSNFYSFNINKFLFVVFGSMAISIRPYLLFNLILLPVWRSLSLNLINFSNHGGIIRIFYDVRKLFISWILPLLFFIAILNVSPYILTNNFGLFFNGVLFNSQELVPASIVLGFKLHVYHIFATLTNLPSFLALLSGLIGIIFLIKFFKEPYIFLKNKINIDIFFFSIIFPLTLYFCISLKHFWDHYWNLYSPYLILSLTYIFLGVFKNEKISIDRSQKLFFKIIILSLFLTILKQDIYKIAGDLSNYDLKHREYENKIVVEKYINNQEPNKKSFLYPNSTYIHWQLDQNRSKFPHNSHILHINKGFWKNISKFGFLSMPANNSELCEMYQNSGPEIIILDKIDSSYSCLNSDYSNYFIDYEHNLKNEKKVYFFKRKN